MTLPQTAPTPALPAAPFPYGRVLLLALGVLTTVTTEMLPAGVLPAIARDFGTPLGGAGAFLSTWAVTIGVASLPLVRLLGRLDRRTVLAGALGVMAVANAAVAVVPVFELAIAFRVVAAAAHGVFWSIVMVVAASLAPAGRMGRAVSLTTAGSTAALLLGIPLGTAVGEVAGWRAAFLGLAAVMAVVAVAVRAVLPPRPAAAPAPPSGRAVRGGGFGRVILIAVAQLLVAAGHFTTYAYIAPLLTAAGVPSDQVSALLFAFGVGGVVGFVLATVVADRLPRAGLAVALAALAVALGLAAVATGAALVAVLVLWGIALGAIPALFFARTLGVAPPGGRDTASALAVVSFNFGIAAGAVVGGLLVDSVGAGSTPVVAAAFAVAAFAVAVGSYRLD